VSSTYTSPTEFAEIEELCENYQGALCVVAQRAAELRRLSALAGRMEKGDESALRDLRWLYDSVAALEEQVNSLEVDLASLEQETGELEEISDVADQQRESLLLLKSTLEAVASSDDPVTSRATMRTNPSTNSYGMDSHLDTHPAFGSRSLLSPAARTTNPAFSLDRIAITTFISHGRALHGPRRVTEDDLKCVPRTVRGQISLSAINDALDEIQTYARRKAARTEREERTNSKIYKYQNSSRHHLRQNQVEKYRSQIREVGEADDSTMVFTEQELRQACAFFRSGEATARSLLLILCGANRLKQVRGGKNGLVYYHIPQHHHLSQQQRPGEESTSVPSSLESHPR
jgi:vacuolar-type H+-ATPase subunit I/STV1